jgi:hypothetical protein
MEGFTPAALIGLCVGFLWGIGCSLAILYSIYLGGYRKAIKDSLAAEKSPRYLETLRKIEKRRAKKKARAAQQ